MHVTIAPRKRRWRGKELRILIYSYYLSVRSSQPFVCPTQFSATLFLLRVFVGHSNHSKRKKARYRNKILMAASTDLSLICLHQTHASHPSSYIHQIRLLPSPLPSPPPPIFPAPSPPPSHFPSASFRPPWPSPSRYTQESSSPDGRPLRSRCSSRCYR